MAPRACCAFHPCCYQIPKPDARSGRVSVDRVLQVLVQLTIDRLPLLSTRVDLLALIPLLLEEAN